MDGRTTPLAETAPKELFTDTVEEALRIDPPVIGRRRRAKADVAIGDVTVPAGSRILLMFGSANHDGEVFPEPEVFDVDWCNLQANLAFGAGEPLCLGAPPARLEGRVVLEEMVAGFPEPTRPPAAVRVGPGRADHPPRGPDR